MIGRRLDLVHHRTARLLPWLAVLVSTCGDVAAAPPPTHPCASVVGPAERLACYDAAFGAPEPDADRAANGHARIEPEPGEAAAVSQSPAKSIDQFGASPARERTSRTVSERELAPDRIEARITGVARRATGQKVITLDNGQVWMQLENERHGQLSEGDRVVISKAALGSFLLQPKAGGPMRVRRIQ